MFVLSCPYSDINISFTGETDRIRSELARTELELLDILEANGISSIAALHGEEEKILTDPQIFDIIMFVIHDLEAENKIFCRCKAGEGEFNVVVLDDAICISCKNAVPSATSRPTSARCPRLSQLRQPAFGIKIRRVSVRGATPPAFSSGLCPNALVPLFVGLCPTPRSRYFLKKHFENPQETFNTILTIKQRGPTSRCVAAICPPTESGREAGMRR